MVLILKISPFWTKLQTPKDSPRLRNPNVKFGRGTQSTFSWLFKHGFDKRGTITIVNEEYVFFIEKMHIYFSFINIKKMWHAGLRATEAEGRSFEANRFVDNRTSQTRAPPIKQLKH